MIENQVYALLAEMSRNGEPGALATVIRAERSAPRHPGSKMVIRADGATVGSVGGGAVEAKVRAAAREIIAGGGCRTLEFDLDGKDGVCGGGVSVFVEPVGTGTRLVIIGGGHVGGAVVELAAGLPFLITIVDDREDVAPPQGAELVTAEPGAWADALSLDSRTAVLLANRSHDLDGVALQAVFAAEERCGCRCAWIGVIGSSGKARQLRRLFADDPGRLERFENVAVPAGLAIGAETPVEIALSVLAEIMTAVRGAGFSAGEDGAPAAVLLQRRRPRRGPKEERS